MADTRLWVRLITKNRISKDITVSCAYTEWEEALDEACRKLDTPRPIVIDKHRRDWEAFSQARFLPDHFLETVSFDRMEAEFINPEEKKAFNEKYL